MTAFSLWVAFGALALGFMALAYALNALRTAAAALEAVEQRCHLLARQRDIAVHALAKYSDCDFSELEDNH